MCDLREPTREEWVEAARLRFEAARRMAFYRPSQFEALGARFFDFRRAALKAQLRAGFKALLNAALAERGRR